jgi:uncharacterized protein (TIGR02646 family)
MIRVQKSSLPAKVASKLKKHEANYFAAKAAGDSDLVAKLRNKYSVVKKHLVTDFHGKCAYCESKMMHISAGQTDHIVPVSHDEQKLFDWENLVLACENCNRNKSAYHDEDLQLINPLVDDPSVHLTFVGAMIEQLDQRGEITISQMQLDRSELTCVRFERLRKLKDTFARLSPSNSPAMQKMILNELQNEGDRHKEFSMMVKLYVKLKLEMLGPPVRRKLSTGGS